VLERKDLFLAIIVRVIVLLSFKQDLVPIELDYGQSKWSSGSKTRGDIHRSSSSKGISSMVFHGVMEDDD
jgi:hypothetical protein